MNKRILTGDDAHSLRQMTGLNKEGYEFTPVAVQLDCIVGIRIRPCLARLRIAGVGLVKLSDGYARILRGAF